jgi:hypothetical protein
LRYAALIERGSSLIVYPEVRSVSGVLSVAEPVKRVEVSVSSGELGAAIREALGNSRAGAPHPHPEESLSRLRPVLVAAKAKSWSALVRGAKSLEILEEAGKIVLTPTENRGARRGFWHLPDLDVAVSKEASDEDLGAAAVRALGLSK